MTLGPQKRKSSWFDWGQAKDEPPPITEPQSPSEGTPYVKYVFLDVVGFTRKRSVEVQAEIVRQLNRAVKSAFTPKPPGPDTIFIPTGDGMAIALINNPEVDAHLQLALRILHQIKVVNGTMATRKFDFDVRIGLNENFDNLILDINGLQNVAGAGISIAQRIMDKADAGQVLVGEAVHTVLNPREEYMDKFRKYETKDKHGEPLTVYQYIAEYKGINTKVPSAFAPRVSPPVEKRKFTSVVAYYVSFANANREFLLTKNGDPGRDYVAPILLYFLAHDASEESSRNLHEAPPLQYTWGSSDTTFEARYSHYRAMEIGVLSTLSKLIGTEYLYPYEEHFQGWGSGFINFAFVKPEALEKVCAEWPDIAQHFGLSAQESGK